MLDDEGGTLRTVAWSEIFPWLGILRCFRLAIGLRVLFLGTVGFVATVSVWAALGIIFSGDPAIERQVAPYHGCPWLAVRELVPPAPDLSTLGGDLTVDVPSSVLERTANPFSGSWEQLSRPFRQIFVFGMTSTRLAFLLLCGLWALAVWALFGGAVTRIVAVEFASGERAGMGAVLRYAAARWRSYFAAPLGPLLVVLVGTLVLGALGLFLQADRGMLVAGVIWPLLLLGGLVMAGLLVGLLFGWPLMWATISAEGGDSFDALSRSYSYVFQRPLRGLFYVAVAVLFGSLCWYLVSNFAAGVITLTYWATAWGGTQARVDAVMNGGGDLGGVAAGGAKLIGVWCDCVKMLAVGFLYSYFWTASTVIYFLLRRDCDATEMDEVFLEEEDDEPPYGLPPLETDHAGAPVVRDPPEAPGRDTDPPSPD